jgi:hypothetical protein
MILTGDHFIPILKTGELALGQLQKTILSSCRLNIKIILYSHNSGNHGIEGLTRCKLTVIFEYASLRKFLGVFVS